MRAAGARGAMHAVRTTGAIDATVRSLVGLALALASFSLPAPVAAIDVAPQDSVTAISEDLATTLTNARNLASVLDVPIELVAKTATCDGEEARLARCDAGGGCHAALVALYGGFLAAKERATDGFVRRSAARAATDLADVALRLGSAIDEARTGRCGRVSPPHSRGVRMRLDADGRTARFSPLTALRTGRSYALVVDGVSPEVRTALAGTVVPRIEAGRTVIPRGSLTGPIEGVLAEIPASVDAARARETAARVEQDAAGLPGLPSLAVVQATFPAVVSAEMLAGMRARFVPAGGAPPADAVATFPVIDARAGLRAYRARVEGLPCVEAPAKPIDPGPVLGAAPATLGGLFEGRYPSIDVVGGKDEPGKARVVLGLAADAAKDVELPYLLALPRGAGPETPLVIAVDGHMGSAARALRQHGPGLLARGLAVLALELPEHGARDTPDGEFADRFDPVPVNRNIRQSATDVMAAVHAILDCGLVLPDGLRVKPRTVSYVGYSLGAMVGAVTRGVEPRLGPTVLVAGAGDFAGWLMLQLIPRLGPPLLGCVGGPDSGRSCFPSGKCAAPGGCAIDARLFWLTEGFRPPYTLLAAGADPLDFAGHRTGTASKAPLLLLTGGNDIILYPLLATRLSDAYAMHPAGPGVRHGPSSTRVHFPDRGHEMINAPEVLSTAHDFLAGAGKHAPHAAPPPAPTAAPAR